MPFLIPADYEPIIRTEVYSAVTRNSAAVAASVELTARSEASSYLRARYDVTKCLPDVTPWAIGTTYVATALVYHGTPQIIYRALAGGAGTEPGTTGSETVWEVADPRHPLLRTYVVDIALYHAHSAIPQKMIPELRVIRYEAAIAWLKAVSRGDISPDLPLTPDGTGTPADVTIRTGSRPKYSADR